MLTDSKNICDFFLKKDCEFKSVSKYNEISELFTQIQ